MFICVQALMWQDDVSLVAQHVLGTLRSAAQPSSTSTRRSRGVGPQQHEQRSNQAVRQPAAKAAVTQQQQRNGRGPVVPVKRKMLALGTDGGGHAADGAEGAAAEVRLIQGAGSVASHGHVRVSSWLPLWHNTVHGS